jgi:peptidyl-prolyl cis-trans isomerase C
MSRWTVALAAVGLVAAACDDREVVARVGSGRITRAELELFRHGRADAPDRALEALIERALFAEGAAKRDLEKDPVIAARIAAARREILANALLDRASQQVMTEDALRKLYEADRAKLEAREIHVAQLVVRFPQDDPRARAEAQAKINGLYARIRAGADFVDVVKEASEDAATAASGGDLGAVREGQVDPGFFEQAWKLKAGEVSPPFATAFGLHVLKALEEPRKVVPPFEQVRGRLAARARHEAEQKLAQELRADISVRTYPDRIAAAPPSEARATTPGGEP